MNDPRTHYQELANAVAAAIVAIGEIILANGEDAPSKPSNVPNQTPTPETPAPAVEEKGRISSRQLGMLRRLCNERLGGDWQALDASCKAKYGKALSYLSMKEASGLISELLGEGGSHGSQSRSAR